MDRAVVVVVVYLKKRGKNEFSPPSRPPLISQTTTVVGKFHFQRRRPCFPFLSLYPLSLLMSVSASTRDRCSMNNKVQHSTEGDLMCVIHLMIDDSESSHFISKKARTGECFILEKKGRFFIFIFFSSIYYIPPLLRRLKQKRGGIILTCFFIFILLYSKERHNSCKNEKNRPPCFFSSLL
jgi:hypothetical protein